MVTITPEYLGNKELLTGRKVAFLAPSRVSPLAVIPTYEWAAKTVKNGEVIVSGFSSPLEKDVWKIAVETGGSMIMVLVTPPYKRNTPKEFHRLITEGRLLIIFLNLSTRLDRRTAAIRNSYVCDLADSVVFPSIDPASSLYPLFTRLHTLKPTLLLSYTILPPIRLDTL